MKVLKIQEIRKRVFFSLKPQECSEFKIIFLLLFKVSVSAR